MAIYHRLQSPSQNLETSVYQAHSEEIWGKAARGSSLPSVKAYLGPLPANTAGIEFETDIAPHVGSVPQVPKWYLGRCPAVHSVPGYPDFCKMQVTMTKVANPNSGISCNF